MVKKHFGVPPEVEIYRCRIPGYPRGDDQNGAFEFKDGLRTIISSGGGWEHVSVSRRSRTPSYEDMCRIKDIFWPDTQTVMQLHVPKDDHINCHEFCLHLWRPITVEIPRPPSIMVGL